MTDRYAVIGNPIAHSKSPAIHAAFARQTGQDMDYVPLLGSLDHFADDVRRFVDAGGRGLNVTVPFKQQAWALTGQRSLRAQSAEAVNTILVGDGGELRGDNTDGVGLVRDLTHNHGFDFTGREVLLLGAGGAARGVLRPLLESGLRRLTIANRTAAKAVALARADALTLADGARVRGCGLDDIKGRRFDLIVNATSSGLVGSVPRIPDDCLSATGWTYDMLYANEPTPFCLWGTRHGARRVLDGLGMLVEQAAESFMLWRGERPDTAPVMARLRAGN